ncbi:MAG TPA: nicotinamide-nucleotide amidohydrolase family protein [Syntrophobacteraceae bacterium]|nr:nicotinamide-nucleotide amidohydrolase family protein [Syntrophobacteraceae bacterium]
MSNKPSHITGTLLTIGDEILLGDIPNGNAQHIALELRARGFRLDKMITIGDIEDDIVEHLGRCLKKSHFVIATGGLGPTDDDRTCSAVSRAFQRPLVCNSAYAIWLRDRLSQRGVEWSKEMERMAELPAGAVKLGFNMAGFFVLHDDVPCYFLPGVPNEMKHLLEKDVIPDLEARFPDRCAYIKHILRVQGLLEAQVHNKLRLLDPGEGVDIGYYPQGRENWVAIFAAAPNEEACRTLVINADKNITALIGARHISGRNDDCLEKVIGHYLRERGWGLAIAESCTGGLLSRKVSAVPGASDYLDRAFVTYSNRSKMELLGVSEGVLSARGAVSEEVALAMAEGALREAAVEVSAAVTGIAGPTGGTPEKPVGTVFIACVTPMGKKVEKYSFGGTREQIQEGAAQAALVMLWELLAGDGRLVCD